MTLDAPTIRDADLVKQLAEAEGSFGFGLLKAMLERTQSERDSVAAMTPVVRRRAKARCEMQAAPDAEDRHHIHSVLALCALPYRRPPEGTYRFQREYGKSSLVVQAGCLKDPGTGRMTDQGLPYGPKARLLMLHICTMALRQNSNRIEIADSMSAFIRELGFPVTGGKRGTIAQFKEQLNRLAAASMQIGLWNGAHASTINTHPIESFDIWLPTAPEQRTLWSTTLTLDRRFYDSLRQHALPVDIRALRTFAQSARQMDMVLWLAYRLRSIKKSYLISWDALAEQFGSDFAEQRFFRRQFVHDLAAIAEVFPELPARTGEKGLFLTPCDPDILFAPPKRIR